MKTLFGGSSESGSWLVSGGKNLQNLYLLEELCQAAAGGVRCTGPHGDNYAEQIAGLHGGREKAIPCRQIRTRRFLQETKNWVCAGVREAKRKEPQVQVQHTSMRGDIFRACVVLLMPKRFFREGLLLPASKICLIQWRFFLETL